MTALHERLITGAFFCFAYYTGSMLAYTWNRGEMEDRHSRLALPAEVRIEQYESLANEYKAHVYGALAGSGICLLTSLALYEAAAIRERRRTRNINDLFR